MATRTPWPWWPSSYGRPWGSLFVGAITGLPPSDPARSSRPSMAALATKSSST